MKKSIALLACAAVLTGCASVDMASQQASDSAKAFSKPAAGKSGLYVYRDSALGGMVTKDLFVNGECLGKSAPNVFFYKELKAGQKYKISTESQFSPNSIELTAVPGQNHFVRQYITMGLVAGGANLEVVPEATAKAAIAKLKMAAPGTCGNTAPGFSKNNV
ncbi:MAG: DUF2846 domain-containing protein [Pseudomonadota bacterium]|nr:DUF2846 domain-containing protein [Pseudomonadota bacterium]